MARTGPKNPHRSGLSREPRRFEGPEADDRSRKRLTSGTGEIPTIYESTVAKARAREEALSARNRAADEAWEAALAPARLPLGSPDRVPYTEAVKAAVGAHDEVIERWRSS